MRVVGASKPYFAERMTSVIEGDSRPSRRAFRRTRKKTPSYLSIAAKGALGVVRFVAEHEIRIRVAKSTSLFGQVQPPGTAATPIEEEGAARIAYSNRRAARAQYLHPADRVAPLLLGQQHPSPLLCLNAKRTIKLD